MKKAKQKKLERAGWKIGSAQDFLGLTDEEMVLVELKRALIQLLKQVRQENHVTQEQLAKMMKSSQSRVAKIEAAAPNISLDLIVTALATLGVSNKAIGKTISAH